MTVVEKLLEFFNDPEDWSYVFCHEDYGIMSVARAPVIRIPNPDGIRLKLKSNIDICVYKCSNRYFIGYDTPGGTYWSGLLTIDGLFYTIKTL